MANLPSTMKASFVVRDGHDYHFETRDTAIPQLQPSDILLKLSCTGVCGSDFHLASGHMGPTNDILGHEGVGRIIKLGSAVTNIDVGARVGIGWVRDICNNCIACLSPDGERRCREFMTSGRKIDGTFAEYAIVPSRYILRLPETCSDEELAPILCGGVTAYRAVKSCGATPGQWIIVSGAGGGVGALAVQYAKAMGYRVLAIDMGKEEYCLSVGAEAYLDAKVATTGTVNEIAPIVSAAIVTAASGAAYNAAISLLSPLGTLVCIGVPPTDQLIKVHPLEFVDKGIHIIGSAVGTRKDILEAVEFVNRGVVKPSVTIANLDDLTDISKKFDKGTTKYVLKF
jgi:alcohol dehydrogenase, propanol-preferring